MSEGDTSATSPLRLWVHDQLTKLFPNTGVVITSNGQGELFTEWTGMSQDGLTEQWEKEKGGIAVTTSCNSFLSTLVNKIRTAGGLAGGTFQSFDLPVAGGAAWHWYPEAGRRPKSGDFFEMGLRNPKSYKHVGVILDMDYEYIFYNTVEAGQGGPTSGYDSIKRKGPRIFPDPGFMGWVDIDEFFGGWKGPGSK